METPAVRAVCPEKARLVEDYNRATEAYVQSVDELRRQTPTASRPEYEQLRDAAERARLEAENARTALDQHLADHAC